MKKLLRQLVFVTFGLVTSAGASYAGHLSDELLVSTKLSGNNEVPVVTTDALGVATFTLNSSWDTMFVNISTNGLSGEITGIHVHEGMPGANGGVITDLTPFVEGNRVIGYLTGANLTSTQIAKYLSGAYYLNVHTAANPNGEIRGQLELEKDYAYRADLDTIQQNHAVTNNAWGTGYFNVSIDKSMLEVRVVADSLSGAITGAHLHMAAAGSDGPVVLDLGSYIIGNTIVGDIDISAMTTLVDDMTAGNIYINIHTTANAAGEIRGQLWLDNRIAFDSWLNTSQEVTPPTGSTAEGAAYFSLNTTLDTLWYEIQADGLTGVITAAHIHDGAVGVDGAPILDLSSGINNGKISGMATGSTITTSLVSKLLSGGAYINLHTTANASGEIRGQIYRLAREGYALSLEGNQEVPMEFSLAKGGGLVSIDRNQSNAHFMMVVSDLTGPITGAHFHNAAMGVNGGVIYDLTPFFTGISGDDAAFGYWTSASVTPFMLASSVEFRNNAVYVNVHTSEKPAGEVRGQVLRGAVEFQHQSIMNGEMAYDPMFTSGILFSAKLSGGQEVPAVTTNAAGIGGFLLNETRDTLWVNINIDGLSGPITGAHIHQGASGTNGGVVSDLSSMIIDQQIQGFLTNFDLNKFITGDYYVNIHTSANPNGEIRGQISFESAATYMADLDGAQEVPAISTSAFGKGVFNLSKDNSNLEIRIVSTGLSGPITGAHLHLGAAGTNGNVVEDLSMSIVDNYIVANVDPTSYLGDLMAGDIYINIHTDANPGGEIRGQLMLANTFVFDTWMNGAQEVPSAVAPGAGVGAFWFNETWDTLSYNIVVDQISSSISGIHIHNGVAGMSGGVLVDLTGDVNGNRISGFIAGTDLTDALISQMILGETYVNLHTAGFPTGEIRGQVYRLAGDGYSFDMCGGQEIPAVSVNGYGGGILSIDRNHTTAHLMFTTTDLSGAIMGAHLHNGAIGVNGGVVYDVSSSIIDNSGYSYVAIDSANASEIKAGNIYLNVHTSVNANGELRGQIDNEMDCPAITVGIEDQIWDGTLSIYPNPTTGLINLSIDNSQSEKVDISVKDVLGNTIFNQVLSGSQIMQTIDLTEEANGLYFVEISSANQSITKKLIKE